MRIAVVTVGNVQPFVSLALGLKARGHSVRVASNDTCESFIRSAGVEFFPIAGNPTVDIAWSGRNMDGGIDPALLRPGRSALLSAGNLARQKANGTPLYQQRMSQHVADCFAASKDCDALVFSLPGFFGGYSAAEKHGIPCFAAYTDPIHPTRAFPHPLVSGLRLGGASNRLTYAFIRRVFWGLHGSVANHARREVLSLPPISAAGPYAEMDRRKCRVLYAYSPAVLPQPSDWPEWVETTGYWWLDRSPEWKPSPRLVDFLESGPAPVYVGFGSVHVRPGGWDKQAAPDRMMDTIVKALVQSRQRGIVLASGSPEGVSPQSDSVFLSDPVPFDWLYPRMAATVHHGGAGTAGAAFRAGVPSAVVPFTAFQPFWGRRVAELGVGPAPIRPGNVSVDSLSGAITATVQNSDMRSRARALGQRVRNEDGVALAVEAIETSVHKAVRAGA